MSIQTELETLKRNGRATVRNVTEVAQKHDQLVYKLQRTVLYHQVVILTLGMLTMFVLGRSL